MQPPLDAFFQPAPDGGQRLYLHHTPPTGQVLKGAVLYIHPWAEEMNKSRRMAAMASRALAAQGWAVLQVDLLGCGDSSGDFGDATWQAWTDDVVRAAQWLTSRHPEAPLWLWGLRAGALLVGAAGWAPPVISDTLARALSGMRAFNVVVSNVPGPQQPFYINGSRLLAAFPAVPLNPATQGLSVGVLSYDGGVHFGLLADRELEPPLAVVAGALREAIGDLIGAS